MNNRPAKCQHQFLPWLLVLWAFAWPAQALQITDDRGVVVRFAKPPQRIVSLLPSLTETVCALGKCALLVGVDRYSNSPAQVLALPQLGGGLDPNIEAVVAQKPDLVLLATSSRASARLEELGLKVVAIEPKTHADVRLALERIGQLLGVPDAQLVWRDVDAALVVTQKSLPDSIKNTRVYFEVSAAPHGASEASFMGETLARLGVKNIVAGTMGPFPKLNPEFVVRANPDVIMLSERGALGLLQRPGWRNIAAIKNKRVCEFSAAQADVLVRPGPRMAEAAQLMANCLLKKPK
jgi:iron complex transport system substrate-binding protein